MNQGIRTYWPFIFLFGAIILSSCEKEAEPNKPNILFIAIDDLNDWIGVLGGHPQALTPNIDRLAKQGMLFTNAHCQSPVCNPSRASLMTSLYPSTTGIYFLNPEIEKSPVASQQLTLPKRFEAEGYKVAGVGKLFHNAYQQNEKNIAQYGGSLGGFGPRPEQKISPYPGHPLWDWGVYPEQDSLMPDYKVAQWAVDFLNQEQDSAFWLGAGFFRPHVPQFVSQKWFDLYPLESIQLPKVIPADLDDIPPYGVDLTRLEHVSPTHDWILENDQWKPLVQSYLACVSFVDAQVGKVLDALEDSPYVDNTYIVLWSDHGFHLGEKERHAKRSLWEDGTRVPLIIAGPGIGKAQSSDKPAQLLDLYPTLLDLAGLAPDSNLEGHSLKPLLDDLNAPWPHLARSSFGPGNYALISEEFRYIQYNDGSEELYDRSNDPHEWHNIVRDSSHMEILETFRAQIPSKRHPILGTGSTGHKSFAASEARRK